MSKYVQKHQTIWSLQVQMDYLFKREIDKLISTSVTYTFGASLAFLVQKNNKQAV